MANQTVYPYGTGGSLPASIGLINDLTTGGADKALSAEMGKVLDIEINGERITETIELEWEGYLRYSTTRVYKFAVGKSVAGDVISVKLNDYTTYQCAITLCETKGWSVTTGYDSGWKKQNFSYTVPSGKEGYYIRVAVSKQSGSITIAEAESAITETKVTRVINYRANGIVQDIESLQESMEETTLGLDGAKSGLENCEKTLFGGEALIPSVIGFQRWTGNASSRMYRIAKLKAKGGDIVSLKLSDYANYNIALNISASSSFGTLAYDSEWKTADIKYTVPNEYNDYYLRLAIKKSSNAVLYDYEAQAVLSEAKIDRISLVDTTGLENRVSAIDTELRTTLDYTANDYEGRKISIPPTEKHCYIRSLLSLYMDGNLQGGAVFGDYFIQIAQNGEYIGIFDLTQGVRVQVVSSSGAGHAANATFGKEYADPTDPFPLLYVSGYDDKKLHVYRITGTRGAFVFTIVQTITLSISVNGPSVDYDALSGLAVVSGYVGGTWQSADHIALYTFQLPALSAGDITISDFGDAVTIPFIYGGQGSDARDGILYFCAGITDTTIYAIDYKTGEILSKVTPSLPANIEPESLGIWQNKLVVGYANKQLYEISF